MSDKPPPPERPLAEVLDEVLAHEEIEELMAADRAERRKDLVAKGYDPARLKARIDAARAAAYAKPAEAAKPVAKVADLSAARAEKVAATTRWGLFAAAAAVALLVGGGGAQYAATRMPPTTVTYATVGSPPSPWELAAPSRRRALRACALGYYAECQDLLDEAQKIDPEGENNAQVQGARSEIAGSHPEPLYVKPPIGPGERRLQRHP
jgi:phospholipase/lecithinase/hemolysin